MLAIPCKGAGRNGFAVRLLPFRREVPNKFQLGKITWWSADGSEESRPVPDRVAGAP